MTKSHLTSVLTYWMPW